MCVALSHRRSGRASTSTLSLPRRRGRRVTQHSRSSDTRRCEVRVLGPWARGRQLLPAWLMPDVPMLMCVAIAHIWMQALPDGNALVAHSAYNVSTVGHRWCPADGKNGVSLGLGGCHRHGTWTSRPSQTHRMVVHTCCCHSGARSFFSSRPVHREGGSRRGRV